VDDMIVRHSANGDLVVLPPDHEAQVKAMAVRLRLILLQPNSTRRGKLWELHDDETLSPAYKWDLITEAFPLMMAYELDRGTDFEVTMLGRHLAGFVAFARRRLRP